jgi:hypothetical protein
MMIAATLVTRLAFVPEQTVALVARLALVAQLPGRLAWRDPFLQFLDLESDLFAFLHDVTSSLVHGMCVGQNVFPSSMSEIRWEAEPET